MWGEEGERRDRGERGDRGEREEKEESGERGGRRRGQGREGGGLTGIANDGQQVSPGQVDSVADETKRKPTDQQFPLIKAPATQ